MVPWRRRRRRRRRQVTAPGDRGRSRGGRSRWSLAGGRGGLSRVVVARGRGVSYTTGTLTLRSEISIIAELIWIRPASTSIGVKGNN